MSAVPQYLGLPMQPRETRKADAPAAEDGCADERRLQSFWHWFAVGVLLFCWIAEATLCAERGF